MPRAVYRHGSSVFAITSSPRPLLIAEHPDVARRATHSDDSPEIALAARRRFARAIRSCFAHLPVAEIITAAKHKARALRACADYGRRAIDAPLSTVSPSPPESPWSGLVGRAMAIPKYASVLSFIQRISDFGHEPSAPNTEAEPTRTSLLRLPEVLGKRCFTGGAIVLQGMVPVGSRVACRASSKRVITVILLF